MPHRLVTATLGIVAVIATSLVVAAPATAADAKDFDPGFLISDEQFFDGKALDAAGVDAFIAGMNKGCATDRICLRNYRETIKAKTANTRCKAIAAGKSRTAGQIIAAVSTACGISPKAILVILQKEQSLVTATAPGARAFQAAMGAGCPDTAPCDGKYAGFYEQVYYGAYLLKGYTIPGSTHYNRYPVGKTTAIAYHPNSLKNPATCGKKAVLVKNMATHALYVYTPYTPNAAALKNMYGTGDKCSAYGNRNFWRMYTDWFGATGSAGSLAIAALHTKTGGNTGTLGKPVGDIVRLPDRGAGLYQRYANGLIAWNLKVGAFTVSEPLATTWLAGGVTKFGWPKQNTQSSTARGGGVWQNFELGLLAGKTGGKAYALWGSARDEYVKAKGPAGPWGFPLGNRTMATSKLAVQKFDAGTVYRQGAKVHLVATDLVTGFESRGGVTGHLGWPKAKPVASPVRGGGTYQNFEKGLLLTSANGTHAVYGLTRTEYLRRGGVAALGWPTKGRTTVPGSTWKTQPFQDGSIMYKGKTVVLVGAGLEAQAVKSGLVSGKLGKPTGKPANVTANGGGVYQKFKGATLTKQKSSTKVYSVSGSMRTVWDATGRHKGELGWPTSNASKDAKLNLTVQKFQFATVFHNGKKYASVGANMAALAKERGVGTGALGWSTTGVKTATSHGGGEYQKFKGGILTWQAERGAIYVPTAVWKAHAANGGLKALGWPTGKSSVNASGTTTQKFDGGTITVTKAGKVTVALTAE